MRRTEMNDAGQIDGQIARKTDRQFGRQFDRATTSLTPYGMSFWALILAACGGGGGGGGGGPTTAGAPPEKLQREGYVYDGPVKGARVYVDVDGDGQLNPGIDEYVGTTDASGAFRGSISARNSGKRYIVDLSRAKDLGDDKIEGTADDQDLSGFDTWLAPEGASVVSALTHLIATGFYQEQEVRSTFPNFDPLRENPYNEGLTPEKEKAFEVVRKALPDITRLVERNSDLIRENARRIERNSEDIGALKDDLDELKRKFKAVTDAARQQQEQEEAAPPSEPAAPPPAPVVNARPTGRNQAKSGVVEDASANFTANDFTRGARTNDPDQTITHVVITGLPTNGRLLLGGVEVAEGQEIDIGHVRWTINHVSKLTYLSASNGHGANHGSFRFKLRDSGSDNNLSAEYTMRVDVAPTNDDPTGRNQAKSGVREDAVASFTADDFTGVSNANDPGQVITHVVITRLPMNGTLSLDGRPLIQTGEEIEVGQLTRLTYLSASNGHGANHGSFRFKLRDSGRDNNLSAEYTMRVDVAAQPEESPVDALVPAATNTPPTGGDKVKSGKFDNVATSFTRADFTDDANANDPGQTITHIVITGLPTFGELSLGEVAVTLNQAIAVDELTRLAYRLEGGGRGYFRFKLKDSGSADGDRNLSDEYTMRVDVKDSHDPTDAVEVPPTGMVFENNADSNSFSVSFDEGQQITERLLTRIIFRDRDIRDVWFTVDSSNEVVIHTINGIEPLPRSFLAKSFEIRNGNELYLARNFTFNYERLIPGNTVHRPNFEIVLRQKVGDGQEPHLPDLTFTLNVNNVNEKPIVQVISGNTSNILPITTTDRFDTGVIVRIIDPDSLPGSLQQVTHSFSVAGFILEETDSPINPRSSLYDPRVKYYRLMVEAGQTFTPGQSIDLEITGTDPGGLTSEGASVSLTVAAAATTPPTGPSPQEPATSTEEEARARFLHKWTDEHGSEHFSYALAEGARVVMSVAALLRQAGFTGDPAGYMVVLSDSSGETDNIDTGNSHFRDKDKGLPPGLKIRELGGEKELVFVLHENRNSDSSESPVDFDIANDISGNNVYYVNVLVTGGEQQTPNEAPPYFRPAHIHPE